MSEEAAPDLSDAYQDAATLFEAGKSKNEVAQTLHRDGLDRETAIDVTLDVCRMRGEELRRSGQKSVAVGGLFVVIGLALTIFTYAKASGSGGRYLVAYGPVIFGGMQLVRGLVATSQGEKLLRSAVRR